MQGMPETSELAPPSAAGSASLYQRARDAMSTLPLANAHPALTLADAIAKAQLQQEDKRKRELAKEKAKQKSHLATQDKFHGAVPGNDEDSSAYWMFVEVRCMLSLCVTHVSCIAAAKP